MRDTLTDWMTPHPVVVREHTLVVEVAGLMHQHRVRHLPVVDGDGRLVALVDDASVFARVHVVDQRWVPYDSRDAEATASDVSRPSPPITTADRPLVQALQAMLGEGEEAVVVVDVRRRPVGILTVYDAIRHATPVLPRYLTAEQLATPQVLTLEPTQTLGAAIDTMQAHGVTHLVVVEGRRPCGVVSRRNLIEAGADRRPSTSVSSLEPGAVETVRPSDGIQRIATTMVAQKVGCLPVVDAEGHLVGILSSSDVLRALVAVLEDAP